MHSLLRYYFALLLLLGSLCDVFASSMSKITQDGHTIVGNNEDSWETTPQIWFEPAKANQLGACFVGYGSRVPQGGMNTAGLVFDACTMYPTNPPANGKPVAHDLTAFLKKIMYTCSSVQQVYDYAIQFDRHIFDQSMMLFVDSTGKYLVMEADTMMMGDDPNFILSNFSYARRTQPETTFPETYIRGNQFLQNHSGFGFDFSRDLMQAMSEHRERKGDGTLYTTLYDVQSKEVQIYFYHDFTKAYTFNLIAELSKGEHTLMMAELFPPNAEFAVLQSYVTPRTHMILLPVLLATLVLFIVLGAGIASQWFRQLHLAAPRLQYFRISLAALNILLGIYVMVLMNEQEAYYFPAPYYRADRGWLNALSYMPFVIALSGLFFSWLIIRKKLPFGPGGRILYSFNMLLWLTACLAFAYWGFYSVF